MGFVPGDFKQLKDEFNGRIDQTNIVQGVWHDIGGLNQPAFENNWVNYISNGPNTTAAFMKDCVGFVHLKGVIGGGTVTFTAFTLPAGYRPLIIEKFPTVSATSVFGVLRVDSNGDVIPYVSPSGNITLDGITFKGEQ